MAQTVHFTLTEETETAGDYPSAETVLPEKRPSPLARDIANRMRGTPDEETLSPSGEQVARAKGVVGEVETPTEPVPVPEPAPEPEPVPIVEPPGQPPITVEDAIAEVAASVAVQTETTPVATVAMSEDADAVLAGLEQSLEKGLDQIEGLAETLARVAKQEPIEIDPAHPGRFRAVLAVEEERTADDRIIAKNATKWRTPPLPLMLMTKTDLGHDGAEIAGVIEKIVRKGAQIVGEGRFDTGTPGVEAARLVANKILTAVSLDGGDAERELIVEEEDEDGFPIKVLERMTALTILGASVVPFPAFGSTFIEWIAPGTEASADTDLLGEECPECVAVESITAGAPIAFPKAMFADPALDAPTPVRVDGDGHVYGHAALWGTCHTSFPNMCLTPPHSRTDYAHFLLKALPLQEGGFMPVGSITLDGPHASDRLGAIETQAHYDNTGTIVAWVAVGEDEHGIWVSGVLKPGISDEKATDLCGSNLSGDWRKIAGNLELVALLGVPVPGYPVAYSKDDEQLSLVAAGFGPQKRSQSILAAQVTATEKKAEKKFREMQTEIEVLRETVDRLVEQTAPIIRESLARRLTPR